MNKIQKTRQFLQSSLGFSIFLFILIVLLFSLLSPKVSSLLFPFKRQAVLSEFINKTKLEGTINPQSYWQFREFYSPGSFIFSRTGIDSSLIGKAAKEIGIQYNHSRIDLTELLFSAQRLNSLDMLTKQSSLKNIIDLGQFKKDKIISTGKNYLIYQEGIKTIEIVFLLSNSDMQKANGYFDYSDKDKQITEGQNWFNVTSVEEE